MIGVAEIAASTRGVRDAGCGFLALGANDLKVDANCENQRHGHHYQLQKLAKEEQPLERDVACRDSDVLARIMAKLWANHWPELWVNQQLERDLVKKMNQRTECVP
uniref:Uncharacterized protein n=1 Tax=Cannabis sativa TaxID=3483 RepID=A0A803NKY3_CANSA